MKSRLLFVAFLGLSAWSHGQDLSLSVTPTINDMFYYRPASGGPAIYLKGGFSSSLQAEFNGAGSFYLGGGLAYQFGQVDIGPAPAPDVTDDRQRTKAHMVTINLKVGLQMGDDYHLTLDPLLDFQLNKDAADALEDQTGLGISLGAGKKIYFDQVFVLIEPRFWIHNLVPFNANSPALRLTVAGINLGLGLRLD